MRSFAKQQRASSARVLTFWAVALCLALSAVQVSAAPDFLRSYFAGGKDGKAGVVADGPSTSTPLTSIASAANPTADELYFFDESGVIAKVAGGQITIVSGNAGNKTPYVFTVGETVAIADVTYDTVFSLAFDGTGALYVVEDTNGNVIKLDIANSVAYIVANIPDAYSVVPNFSGDALFYSLVSNFDDVFRIDLVPGSLVQGDASPGSSVGKGNFQIFIVNSDETKIYGSVLRDEQFYELTLNDKSVKPLGVVGTVPGTPQVDVPIAEAITGGFSSIAFYGSDKKLIIASDAGYIFYYDVDSDEFSQIAGNGATFDPANDLTFNGRALSNPTSPFFASVSSSGRIYVDFQTSIDPDLYSFFEVLDVHTVSITLSPSSVNEGADATFTISRTITTDQPLNVKLTIGQSSADATDFSSTPAFTGNDVTVTILANQASTTLVVTASSDGLIEPAEDLTINIAPDDAYNIDSTNYFGTLTINDVPTGPTPGTGSIEGDPHFVGFEGQQFDFQGHPGRIYNLISDFDLQVNALYGIQQNTASTFSGGPILDNIAIFTATEKVLIQSGGSNIGTTYSILYNNAVLTEGALLGTNLLVSFTTVKDKLASDYGFNGDDRVFAVVSVEYTGVYKFLIYIIENGRLADGSAFEKAYAHRFLDLNSQIIELSRDPDGVLGQTYTPDVVGTRNVKTRTLAPRFQLKGTTADYEVKDGIYGKDFTYNKFGTIPADIQSY